MESEDIDYTKIEKIFPGISSGLFEINELTYHISYYLENLIDYCYDEKILHRDSSWLLSFSDELNERVQKIYKIINTK